MLARTCSALVLSACLLTACSGGEDDAEVGPVPIDTTAQQSGGDTDAIDDAMQRGSDMLDRAREDFIRRMDEQIAVIQGKIEGYRQQAQQHTGLTREAMNRALQTAQTRLDSTKTQLGQVRTAPADAWRGLADETESLLSDLTGAITEVERYFNNG